MHYLSRTSITAFNTLLTMEQTVQKGGCILRCSLLNYIELSNSKKILLGHHLNGEGMISCFHSSDEDACR